MGNVLTYRGEEVREACGFVEEKAGKYAGLLDQKIEKYIEQLKDFESRCSRPGANEEKLLQEITVLNDEMLDACAQFEREVRDPRAIKAAQVGFRKKTDPILSKSYCINRTRKWPQGQQGDYMTLELAYKNAPLSDGIGYYLDKCMLSATLATGVRERIEKLRDLLRQELTSRRAPKVLDVACGSCREVFELAQEIKRAEAKFTCIDLDPGALDFAVGRFAHAGLTSEHVEVLKYNALRMFDYETAAAEFGMQDVIYSVGYFDYLPDDFLVKTLHSLYKMLNPGGKLIAAFKDARRYRPQLYHWLVDWDGFLQRTEDDFDELFHQANIPGRAVAMTRVKSGSIVFYTATKREPYGKK